METEKYTTDKEKSRHLCLHFKCINLSTYFKLNPELSNHMWAYARTNTQSFYALFSHLYLMYWKSQQTTNEFESTLNHNPINQFPLQQ